jgi:hypothetical protein
LQQPGAPNGGFCQWWNLRNSGSRVAGPVAAVRTAVRTKHPQTVESGGDWWPVVVKWDRRTFQLAVLKRVSRSVAVYDGYGAVYIYGSEGWGFESLRARQKSRSERCIDSCVSNIANNLGGAHLNNLVEANKRSQQKANNRLRHCWIA